MGTRTSPTRSTHTCYTLCVKAWHVYSACGLARKAHAMYVNLQYVCVMNGLLRGPLRRLYTHEYRPDCCSEDHMRKEHDMCVVMNGLAGSGKSGLFCNSPRVCAGAYRSRSHRSALHPYHRHRRRTRNQRTGAHLGYDTHTPPEDARVVESMQFFLPPGGRLRPSSVYTRQAPSCVGP